MSRYEFIVCSITYLPSLFVDTQSGQVLPVSKRRYEEANLEPEMGMEAPSSSANSLSASSRISNDRTASKRKDSTVKDPTKDRLMEIEEEKLVIMKEHLKIERRKVDILEDYVNWRKKMYTEGMENTCTPTVSPIIRGLFTS
ncbi:uncharacterized protein LOC134248770 isoform X2 [Saccostrea cucullata]|uniref:uncharacterized protein LOC134248770 isoform X2 n=1 Tax=Saccostrea cuccullata TaxID=36930 RepID=UPI002ED0FC5B